MRRIVSAVVVVAALAGAADAQSNPEAEARNDEGKKLFADQNYQAAADKFREAIRIAPEPRYQFNLCAALEKAADFQGAIDACNQVLIAPGAPEDLKKKASVRIDAIRAAQGGQRPPDGGTPPPPGGDPNLPPPPPGTYGDGQPPPSTQAAASPGDYRVAIGGDAGWYFGHDVKDLDVAFGMRFYADLTFRPDGVFFGRLFLDVSYFEQSGLGTDGTITLSATDVGPGAAVGAHLELAPNLHATAGLGLGYLHVTGKAEDTFGESVSNDTSATLLTIFASLDLKMSSRLWFYGGLRYDTIKNSDAPAGADDTSSAFVGVVGLEYRFTTLGGGLGSFTLE
jgi:tetratricopeptide (TPR) repeat protein